MTNYKWYNNGQIEKLFFITDEIPHDFIQGRINKLHLLTNQISKEDLLDLYIIKNMSFEDTFSTLQITRRDLRRLLTYYKIKKDAIKRAENNTYVRPKEIIRQVAEKSSETQKKAWQQKTTNEKIAWQEKCRTVMNELSGEPKQRNLNGYRNWWSNLTDKEKQDINQRRSQSCAETWSNPNLIAKQANTRRVNREKKQDMLCRTLAEQKLYNVLIEIYKDLQYDVCLGEQYPYYCDFYIPSMQLFIELQAHPSHGTVPYEMMSNEELSKYSGQWLEVLSKRDVEKRQTFIKNKLNFLRIYPNTTLENNYKINNYKYKTLVEICYKSQK